IPTKDIQTYWMLGEMDIVDEAKKLKPKIEQAEVFFVGVVSDFRKEETVSGSPFGRNKDTIYNVWVQVKLIDGTTLRFTPAEGHGRARDIRDATLGAVIDGTAKLIQRLNAEADSS
ncbi:MAG TPA: hypothetical protein VM285_05270, partial [Polyangia bacterium]|nr:hypothetical protein [Polyangia bacterium]